MNQYYWFCLDHVRAYNAAWDYCAGMTPEEIEEEIRRNVTWDRPTWPLGGGCSRKGGRAWTTRHDIGLQDDFGFFEADPAAFSHRRRATSPAEERALSVLELSYPMTLEDLKARYKLLVKQHHPDANGGDKAAEEKLKIINQAYTTLRAALTA